jgi:hypothetical protein
MTIETTKLTRVMNAFLSGDKHTRFSAERALHDHCLNSTVADIQAKHGVKISRKKILVPGYRGIQTRCCLYWMEPEEIERYNEAKKPNISGKTKLHGEINE